MVLSILDLGNASFAGITASQLNLLQKVQNSATRFIFVLYGKLRWQHIDYWALPERTPFRSSFFLFIFLNLFKKKI